MRRRITHVITGLPVGGSQAMLQKLLAAMDREAWNPDVVSLRDENVVGARIAATGVTVRALGMREQPSALTAVPRLTRWLRQQRTDIVQTWLYHADLIGGLAAWRARVPIVWGIRQSALDPRTNRRSTIWIARACARLSRRIPSRIVCCSEAARQYHAAMGYDPGRMVVIPNGFDVERFRPDPAARRSVRDELSIPPDAPLIGIVARFDPEKDHRTFVHAAGLLCRIRPKVHFLMCGEGIDDANVELTLWIREAGIEAHAHRLGLRDDVPRLTSALDVASLSSSGEGFPNAIGEAMASEVPCAVTDVGESRALVADTGRVVAPRDPAALATAWQDILTLTRDQRSTLGRRARQRIEAEFGIRGVAKQYADLYAGLGGEVMLIPS